MRTYYFQLPSGAEFTIRTGSVKSAWIEAIGYLDAIDQLDGLSELTLTNIV